MDEYFTPIFIFVALCIAVAGFVVINFFDRFFAGTEFHMMFQLIGLTITLNVIVFAFLVMSFSKVKSTAGPKGPRGNKGPQGYSGVDGSLSMCGDFVLRSADIRQRTRASQNLDLTPPTIIQ